MRELSFLDDIQSSNSHTELWWDSSPSVLPTWMQKFSRLNTSDDDSGAEAPALYDAREPLRSLIRGSTTNPRLVADCIFAQGDRWQGVVHQLIDEMPYAPLQTIFWRLYKTVIADGASHLLPLWEATEGRYGWVSAQVDPRDFHDSQRMYQQGVELAALAPNVMVKVPGSTAGYETVEQLVANGISINSTFSYTVPQLHECLRAVEAGLRRRKAVSDRWRCVITFMIGRFGSQGDLIEQAHARGMKLDTAAIRWAEIAIFRRMLDVIAESGVPAKLLLSSIKADFDPHSKSVTCWHLEKTAGSPVVYTLTPTLLQSLIDARYAPPGLAATGMAANHESIPSDVMDRLISLPYFASACSTDGLERTAFHHQGAFIATAAEACASIRRMHDFIAQAFQARHWRRAKESFPVRELTSTQQWAIGETL